MTRQVFRCDYCGSLADVHRVERVWRWVEDMPDGTEIWTTGLYCSEHCGRKAAETELAVGS